jgi:hypothetical protein
MRKASLILAAISGWLIFAQVCAAAAQTCPQVLGGTDLDKLRQNIATCAQDIRASRDPSFTAYLMPQSCKIYMSIAYSDTWFQIPPTFKYCVEQYGWTLPMEVLSNGGYSSPPPWLDVHTH